MRAMRIEALGAPLTLADVPRPEPGPGEVLLKVRACGLNFADTLMVAGRYQEKPPLPLTPGLEVCGTVAALGPGVGGMAGGLAVGTRVACLVGHGGLADYVLAPAAGCVAVPEAMPDAEVAGFLVAYGTSYLALSLARLRPGETLLVLGAAGGVGLTAVEIGHLMGARVIAVARDAARGEVARRAGADHVLGGGDLTAAVRALGGADVVYDPVGGDAFDAALRATRPGGRLIPIGFASGTVPQIPANLLLVKNLTAIGLYFGGYVRERPEVLAASLSALFGWYGLGRLRPHVSNIVPLEAANEGLDLLRTRAATGKVVVAVDGPA